MATGAGSGQAPPTAFDVPSGAPAGAAPEPGDPRLARLSLNQRTVDQCSLPEAVEGCLRAGIGAIGLWREPAAETGIAASARLVRHAGLRVSSYCRGGFLTGHDRAEAMEDNRRAIDEAAELGAPCLVMVVGGLPEGDRDLVGARERMAEAIAELAPYAAERGVCLALEALHPMFCADRAVLSTLGQALDIAERFPVGQVGVVVDTYHVWWDPRVYQDIARAAERIASFQVCDWVLPLPADPLLGRGMVGDGHADIAALHRAVDAAGYTGDIEVEVFNADVWAADPDAVLATLARRHVRYLA
ncbi:sugar phosphate isomerase/epimerase family protein [Streptomonospora wellingtoniae]|uniref:Sugar phosphate isomerase/epimerase n=1 Tax=Streptomonospora wellingtoniae TaxID=3075544 RepID=A0ABU2KU83_9ACTN|nr:sugar phosphate isomerase/epimerase [Streptomonospora sp. DSM 45055]MDT0302683.1 sugar phosphate isomerase/epimerase [Streptomonospora sp. DSM 45055]